MTHILYNKSFELDTKNIDLIINFFEDYKTHLQKKEFQIFKNNIPKILNFMGSLEQNLIQELRHFEKNDSDNEENYSDVYKNCENEDSISEYDTDTDDEDTNKFRKKFIIKTLSVKNYYELLQSQLPVKFKKIKN